MRIFYIRAVAAAVLMTSSVGVVAAPQGRSKPTKPTPPPKPQPPTDSTAGGDFVQCVNDGNSVQICMIRFGG